MDGKQSIGTTPSWNRLWLARGLVAVLAAALLVLCMAAFPSAAIGEPVSGAPADEGALSAQVHICSAAGHSGLQLVE